MLDITARDPILAGHEAPAASRGTTVPVVELGTRKPPGLRLPENVLSSAPQVTRIRHEIRRRVLDVARVERIAPQMVRIVLTGPALEGFTSLGFDDHVKLFFPPQAANGTPAAPDARPEARDFTPRHYDAGGGELWIDFFLHEAGPATSWASRARPGDTLEVGGPKGSAVLSPDGIDLHLMVGDETAIPAIARRLAELPAGTRALVVTELDETEGWPDFSSAAQFEVIRVPRGASNEPAGALIERLRTMELPATGCFVWVALESQAARALRRYFTTERGVAKEWIKASAYWQRGDIGKHERIED